MAGCAAVSNWAPISAAIVNIFMPVCPSLFGRNTIVVRSAERRGPDDDDGRDADADRDPAERRRTAAAIPLVLGSAESAHVLAGEQQPHRLAPGNAELEPLAEPQLRPAVGAK